MAHPYGKPSMHGCPSPTFLEYQDLHIFKLEFVAFSFKLAELFQADLLPLMFMKEVMS
jgi:hypothetical protein